MSVRIAVEIPVEPGATECGIIYPATQVRRGRCDALEEPSHPCAKPADHEGDCECAEGCCWWNRDNALNERARQEATARKQIADGTATLVALGLAAELPPTGPCDNLRAAVNASCACGGMGPNDPGMCPACMVWHRMKSLQPKPEET
jgi:hypothetical protein